MRIPSDWLALALGSQEPSASERLDALARSEANFKIV
jgi:hypothetical protein